jgi:hypothetical protein
MNAFRGPAYFLILFFMAASGVMASEGEDRAYPARVLSSGVFPCSGCHAGMETDSRKRKLAFHEDIIIKGHGEPQRWCLDCHDVGDRDRLRLQSGEKVDFMDSHKLCGQCHGNTYRDWRAGVHGKRTGFWDGPKEYFLCTHCHNPHSPAFAHIAPEPAPVRPEDTLRR